MQFLIFPKYIFFKFEELSDMLKSRGYNKNVINSAIKVASLVERKDALIEVKKVKKYRTVLAITYKPMLPSLSQIVKKHWNTMAQDKHAIEIFAKPPNLKQNLCRAKLPTGKRPHRQQFGMQRCTHQCPVCEG